MAEVLPTPWRPLVSGVVDPDELSFGPGVPIIAEPLGGAVIWAAFAEIAQEWLSAPWDWPAERSSRLETAAPLEVGAVFALHGPGWPEVPARFYEVFEADGCRSRCVPWPRAGGDA